MSSTIVDTTMVVHGPEAFDRGDVARLRAQIVPDRLIVAGVMGRTAAEESGIPFLHRPDPPSSILASLDMHERAFLVNRGKSPESGEIFGEIVAGRLDRSRGLVQVECSNDIIYRWNGGDAELAGWLADTTGFVLVQRETGQADPSPRRTIRGCSPGEAVFVNGVVIGEATAPTVTIEHRNGELRAVSGLRIKEHGIEKLMRQGPVDPGSAWCKSGRVRRNAPQMRSRRTTTGRIRVVDHAGIDLYRNTHEGVCGVLSIGDDTTAVCGHICAHLGIPVFGVVDGDADGIVDPAYPPGSVVVEVIGGRDDDVGAALAKGLDDAPRHWDSWVREQLDFLGKDVRIIVNSVPR
jgi:hypothetical protein